jgi:hypothetical protein
MSRCMFDPGRSLIDIGCHYLLAYNFAHFKICTLPCTLPETTKRTAAHCRAHYCAHTTVRTATHCCAHYRTLLLAMPHTVALPADSRILPLALPYTIREGDPKGWSTVLITALNSWEKTVPRSQHTIKRTATHCCAHCAHTTVRTAANCRSHCRTLLPHCRTATLPHSRRATKFIYIHINSHKFRFIV